jgi:four helix bundle protein
MEQLMATFKKFEEMEVWKKSRELNREIYGISNGAGFCRDFSLRDQIRRASISIMSNIAEGFERDGKKEFIHFLAIAKGSAGEVRSQLYIALDQNYISPEIFENLIVKITEIGKMLKGLIGYLSKSAFKGTKFK